MNTAVIVTVTTSVGLFQSPPAGATTRPGGRPLVTSVCLADGSLSKVNTQRSGWALLNEKVTGSVAGIIVVELNAPTGGATVTMGGVASASSGGNGGASCPSGTGAVVLSSSVV